jgi:nitrite reductase/ring-hydroxylating ferredoxin subunit
LNRTLQVKAKELGCTNPYVRSGVIPLDAWALSEFVKVCEVSDVPPGTMHPVDVGERKLMIVNLDGSLYALARICTHETADLSTGFLLGSAVICPLHLSRFDVKTGAVENPPATVPLAMYGLKIEGTSVYVRV